MSDSIEHWMYATGEMVRLPVRARLAEARSEFQEIVIVDVERFGRCLLLDGIMQTSEHDHALYDDALLRRVGLDDRRLLVLGGGDGYVALRAVERWPDLRVSVVEIDPAVLDVALRWLNPGLRDHPRVEVIVGDGLAYAREQAARAPGSFCGVVLDLTDAPVDPSRASAVEALYEQLVQAAIPLVRPGGWFAAQAGAPVVVEGGLHLPSLLERLLAPHLVDREQVDVLLPSYGEPNSFVLGRRP